MKSWNKKENKDCFGNRMPTDIDHAWPKSKGGSNIKENRQLLSKESNKAKGDNTKGTINGIRYAVKRMTSKDGHVYGVMMIKIDGEWIDVIKVNS